MNKGKQISKLFNTSFVWYKTTNANYPLHHMDKDDSDLIIRINDFPVEPFYTLLRDGQELAHFDDWPACWKIIESEK